MIKLSKLTDYSIVILSEMAYEPGGLMTASGLSQKTGLPEPTVSKVLKLLTRGEVIISTRGVNGGYSLERDPKEITIASVVTALDGPVALTACCIKSEETCCDYEETCKIKDQWSPVNEAMRDALESVSLDQMMKR